MPGAEQSERLSRPREGDRAPEPGSEPLIRGAAGLGGLFQLDFPDFLPPSRPAARFCDLEPPLPLPLFSPPFFDDSEEFAIEAARCLLIPFLRSPSYCLSSLTLDPWSFAISEPPSAYGFST